MTLRELTELIESLPYPPETEIIELSLEVRLRLPGGVTVVTHHYPVPDPTKIKKDPDA
jgi:hypothetical protein